MASYDSERDFYCVIDDEDNSRQYEIRLTYALDGFDPGDQMTPPCAEELELLRVVVTQARHLNEQGDIVRVESQQHAESYNARARRLVEGNSCILRRLRAESH